MSVSPANANAGSNGENSHRRSVFLIDRAYQINEINRSIGQFVLLIFAQIALFVLVAHFHRTGTLTDIQAPVAYVIIAFAVPSILCSLYSWRTIKHTHHVAGAAYRISQDVHNIIIDPKFRFHLREGDYLQNVALELNNVMEKVDAHNEALLKAAVEFETLQDAIDDVSGKLGESEAEKIRNAISALEKTMSDIKFCESPQEK
ncbi:MAG: hypothetical protein JXR97_08825 [Planctomycetes bacterium]|nr:hypothetical protein [Planctomycetota bacterium]